MFGFGAKLPVTEDEREWVDDGFDRLSRMLGRNRMLDCAIVQPTDEFFPDTYDGSESALENLFRRVCTYMRVDRKTVELAVIPDTHDFRELLPEYRHASNDPAGLHFGGESNGELPVVALKAVLRQDPLAAVATLAHELGHVILLGGRHMSHDTEDMEPMTDLVTVFLGLGIFTANAARRFKQYENDRRYGWSMKRLGYLPEVVYGYALARFARERGEERPEWTGHLSTNLKTYFRQSAAWLERDSRLL